MLVSIIKGNDIILIMVFDGWIIKKKGIDKKVITWM